MTDNVSLPDQYVLLLQNVVEENRLLRQQLSSTVTSNENALKGIKMQMDILARTSTSFRRVRQTGQNMQNVPKACSVSKDFNIRQAIFHMLVYKSLYNLQYSCQN